MAQIFAGEGERGAAAIRRAVEVLERSDELRRRSPPPRLGGHGSAVAARRHRSDRALADRALEAARRSLRSVCCRSCSLTWPSTRLPPTAGPRPRPAFTKRSAWPARPVSAPNWPGHWPGWRWLEARQGRPGQSRLHATEALALSRRLGLGLSEVWAIAALGELELGLGHPAQALATSRSSRPCSVASASATLTCRPRRSSPSSTCASGGAGGSWRRRGY